MESILCIFIYLLNQLKLIIPSLRIDGGGGGLLAVSSLERLFFVMHGATHFLDFNMTDLTVLYQPINPQRSVTY